MFETLHDPKSIEPAIEWAKNHSEYQTLDDLLDAAEDRPGFIPLTTDIAGGWMESFNIKKGDEIISLVRYQFVIKTWLIEVVLKYGTKSEDKLYCWLAS